MAKKKLSFEVSLNTGKLAQNMKNCVTNMNKAWHDFGKNMQQSKSITNVANSLFLLGKGGSEAIMSLVDPYQTIIKKTIELGVALYGLTARYAELEKAAYKASRAFKTYGASNNFEAHSQHLKEVVTNNGAGDYTSSMKVLADMRRKAPGLKDADFSFAIDNAKDMSAQVGSSYEDSLERILTLLNKESVSYDDLLEAGVSITRENLYQIEQLNNIANLEQRNAALKKMIAKDVRGAAEGEVKTIAEVYERLGNMIKNMWTNIGEMLAPLAKAFFKIGQFVMNMVDGFLQPFIKFASIVGKIFNPLINMLDKSSAFAKGLGTALAFVAAWLAKGAIVQGIMLIVSSLGALLSPIGLVIGAITLLATYWDQVVEGFKQGIGEENIKALQQWLSGCWEVLKGFAASVWEFCEQFGVFEVLGVMLQDLFYGIGTLFNWLGQILVGFIKILSWVEKGIARIYRAIGLTAFADWHQGVAGFLDSILGAGKYAKKKEDKKEEKKEAKKGFVDPRLKFDSSFEGASSMNQRIQKSILSKSSPQVRMCDYLATISQYVQIIKNGQERQTNIVEQESKSASETAKNTKQRPDAVLA